MEVSLLRVEAQVTRLRGMDSTSTETREAFSHLQQEESKCQEQAQRILLALQVRADEDRDMLHTAVQGSKWIQSPLVVECKRRHSIAPTQLSSQLHVMDHCLFAIITHEYLHFKIDRRFEACWQPVLVQVA